MVHGPVFCAVIGIYFLVMIAVSVVLKRLNRNSSDYFRSGCRATWWLTGVAAFMSSFSVWSFTGMADLAYSHGGSALLISTGLFASVVVNALVLGPWFRQMRVVTFPEVLEQRFGRATQQFYAWLSVIKQIFFSAVRLYSVSVFLIVIFRLSLMPTIIVVGAIAVIYAAIGGTWAVMSNGFLQGLILVPVTVAVAALSLAEIGGVGPLFTAIRQHALTADFAVLKPGGFAADLGWGWALALFLQSFVGGTSVVDATTYFKVKDGREARRLAVLQAVLTLVGAVLFVIPPVVARILHADAVGATGLQRPGEGAYAVASISVLPSSMFALVVVTMLAVTMSSLNNQLNLNAGVLVRDILPPLRRKFGGGAFSDRGEVAASQAATALMGAGFVALACYFARAGGPGLFATMFDVTALIAVPLYVPLCLMTFIRKVPSWTAIVSVGAGLGISTCGYFSGELFGTVWSYQVKVVANIAAGTAAYLICALFWRLSATDYRARVAAFYEKMLRPVDFAAEVGPGNDRTQLRTIGFFATVIGALICLLMLVHATGRERWIIGAVGGFNLLIGWGFLTLSRRPDPGLTAAEGARP